jgi:hypothetical protein
MRRVRALDKISGEFVKELHADELSPPSRYAYQYCCLDSACTKTYHWRKSYRMDGNKVQVPATFVENRSAAHRSGCRYDFMKIAARHRDVAFFQDEAFHLRINFPLGGYHTDVHVPNIHLGRDYAAAARTHNHGDFSMPGLASMGAVVKFLEKEFGFIEASQTDILRLHYQGANYGWRNMYAGSDRYQHIVDVPQEAANALTQSRLAVVKIIAESAKSKKGKRRFLCEPQDAKVAGRTLSVQPSLVCANENIATIFNEIIERDCPILVAARPFTGDLSKGEKFVPRKVCPVALYVADTAQFAPVSSSYWHRPALQLGLDLGNDLA